MIMSKQSGVSNIIYGLLVIAILSAAIFGLTRLESTFDTELSDINTEVASISTSISSDPAISVSAAADSSIINYQHYTIDYDIDYNFFVLDNHTSQLLLDTYLINTPSADEDFDTDLYMGYFSSDSGNTISRYPTFIPTNHDTHSCETLFPDVHTHSFSISEYFLLTLVGLEAESDNFLANLSIDFVKDQQPLSRLTLSYGINNGANIQFKYDENGPDTSTMDILPSRINCTISGDTTSLDNFHAINVEFAQGYYGEAELALNNLVNAVNDLLTTGIFNLNGSETGIQAITEDEIEVDSTEELTELKGILLGLDEHYEDSFIWSLRTDLALRTINEFTSMDTGEHGESWDDLHLNFGQLGITGIMLTINTNGQKIYDAISLAEGDTCEIEFAADNSGNMVLSNSPVCQYPDDAFAETISGTDYIQLSSYNGTCDSVSGGIDNSHRIQIVDFGDIASESSNSFVDEDITVSAFKPDADTLKITINGANVSYNDVTYASGNPIDINMAGFAEGCLYWANKEW